MNNNTIDLKAIRFIPGTKVSHDYSGSDVHTFSYRELIERNSPAIGIPCKENGILVIDVDVISEQHKFDGREFWTNFCEENGIPSTYTVQTGSGGYHFYFSLPVGLNLETFRPPAKLADGVDVKFRGWVGAPPSPGYTILKGDLTTIQEAPPSLLAFMATSSDRGMDAKTFDNPALGIAFTAHTPFTEVQLGELKSKLKWLQSNGSLDRSEWRDGLFALKAGVDDPNILDELVDMWTMNKNYIAGDEDEARSIVSKADKYGPIGPGTIFAILGAVIRREGATALETPYTAEEIINRSKVAYSFTKSGTLKIEPSESNASALMGAMYDLKDLHHDVRSDQYIYQGKPYSDTELVNKLMPLLQSSHAGLGLEKFRKSSILSGIDVLMSSRQVDPHMEFLKHLEWDGKPRIEQFFQTYIGVDDTPYHRKVSKNFWVALAARGLRPGCKFDTVLILEGAEGIRKSSLVEAIGGEYTFAPSRKDSMENLDELRKMHQSVIVELPELMGLINESSEKVKAFLASSFDNIRALYARKAVKQPRGFVFVGTTNSDKYITQSMGLRRFWPVKIPGHVKVIDIDGIKRDREQLFAEACRYFADGYEFYDMPIEYLKEQAGNKVIVDPLTDSIERLLAGLNFASTSEMYSSLEASNFISKGFTPKIKGRIENVLSMIGFASDGDGGWNRIKKVEEGGNEVIADDNTFHGFDLSNVV